MDAQQVGFCVCMWGGGGACEAVPYSPWQLLRASSPLPVFLFLGPGGEEARFHPPADWVTGVQISGGDWYTARGGSLGREVSRSHSLRGPGERSRDTVSAKRKTQADVTLVFKIAV